MIDSQKDRKADTIWKLYFRFMNIFFFFTEMLCKSVLKPNFSDSKQI